MGLLYVNGARLHDDDQHAIEALRIAESNRKHADVCEVLADAYPAAEVRAATEIRSAVEAVRAPHVS